MANRSAAAERTRRTIELALVRLLESKPYASITVSEIAREADVAERTVQRHYGTKDGLLAACVALPRHALAEGLKARPEATSAEEELRNFVAVRFGIQERYRAQHMATLTRAEELQELQGVVNEARTAVKREIQALVARWPGAWAVEKERAVAVLLGATSQYGWRAFTEGANISRAQAAKVVADTLCAYLLRRQS